ncbi:MAG: ROK family protein [Bacillota bacterium]|nr:ROK family protein [Bacillota bacterium]
MMYLAIDLGGTNIKAGLVDEDGKIINRAQRPTLAHRGYEEIAKDMALCAIEAAETAGVSMDDIESVGIGSPGTIDNNRGIIVYANNINFRNTPIRSEMQKYINKPIYMGNDADCAALGEYVMLKKDMKSFVFVTLGTGVGGGIIIDGKLFSGFNGAGGELGHMTLVKGGKKCTCGRKGCYEAYASVTGLIDATKQAILENPNSYLASLCKNNLEEVGGKTAFLAAKDGDELGKKIVDEWIGYVSEGITNIVNIFQPEVLAIGGAISKEGDTILKPITEFVEKYRYSKDVDQTRLEIARLGNDAGLIGAAFLGKH